MKLNTITPYILCFFFSLLLHFTGISQCSIKGSIIDSLQGPVPYTPVGLLNTKDSSVYKGEVSDQQGNYCFSTIQNGEYFIKITAIGFNTFYSQKINIDSTGEIKLPAFTLKNSGTSLNEIEVAAFKPTIEFKKGTIILNVENNLVAKGNTVLDLLKKIPGVIVDAQNNVTINGVGGVRFLMDGRLQQLSDVQMATILSGMSAETITSIELIKNPPAKYDAEGTGGLINIVTKKAKLKGMNGSINESYSQGKKGRSFSVLTLNFKNNKLSAFSNLSYGYQNMYELTRLDRTLTTSGSNNVFNQRGNLLTKQQTVNFNGGIEYEFSPKTIIGLFINDNLNNAIPIQQANTTVLEGDAFNYHSFSYRSEQNQTYNSPNVNFNILRKLDTLGSQLQLSSDYTDITGDDHKFVENHFYDQAHAEILLPTQYTTTIKSRYNIFFPKLDYTKMFKHDLSIESGLKGNFITIHNDADYTLQNSTGDTALKNNYIYKECVLAAYATLSKNYKKIGATLGLRAEQTDVNGISKTSVFTLTRNYFNFFPSSSLDYKINEKNALSGSYSYRIRRPGFERMNPARIYNDELNYTVGNPTIKPQYAHVMSLNYDYNHFITATFDYRRIHNFMYWYSYANKQSKINIDTTFNFRLRNNYSLSVFMQKQIKWLNLQIYSAVMYFDFRSDIQGQNADSKAMQFYTNIRTEIMLPKNFKLQVSGFYSSPFYDAIQIYTPVSSINLVINKSFLKNKLDVSLSFFDILYKENQSVSSTLSDQYYYQAYRGDTRRVQLTLNYKFGKMQIEQKIKQEDNDGRFRK
jgi:iron complex outermembrane receptor protein